MAEKKIVLITGAGRRIGQSLALFFASQGWGVALHANTSFVEAGETAQKIQREGGQAAAFCYDFSDTQGIEAFFLEVKEAMGGEISCLVNNASLFVPDTLHNFSSAQWTAHMTVNGLAPLLLTRFFAEQSAGKGVVINLLDASVWHLSPRYFSYSLSRKHLADLTTEMAREYAPHIRVMGLALGFVIPEEGKEAEFEALVQKTPLKCETRLDEIHGAMQWFLGSPSLTGAIVALDSGAHLA